MSLHQLANHVAAHGRNGDSTLVHMTKGEVAGLQALAKRNGTSLTINPHTGLPEAFSLKSLLPLAAGFALGPAGFGIAASAMEAGLMVGGATALATGDLKQGLMAGLGAYGGAGLGGAGAAAGGTGATEAGTQTVAGEEAAKQAAAEETAKQAAAQQTAQQAAATNTGMSGSGLGFTGQEGMTQANTMGLTQNVAANGGAQGWTMPSYGGTLGEQGVTSANYVPTGSGIGTSQAALGSGSAIPAPVAAPAPGSFAGIAANAQAHPSYLLAAGAPAIAEDMSKAATPYQQPEIKSDADMGQRWGFTSGYDNSVPGRTGQATYSALSNEEAKKRYGFAEGGDVQSSDGWQQENEPVVRMFGGGISDVMHELMKKAKDQGLFDSKDGSSFDSGTGYTYDPNTQKYTPNMAAGGGISSLGSYSDGGRLLKGPGDGMSDNIPAQIGSKQPARLADGEFVVPADVVSHLGNGSTDAGAKQLYSMMDKIRQARTGRKAQGKQINPQKYLPA